MELNELLNDLTPEELEPRLELQVLVDPLSTGASPSDNNNNNNNVQPKPQPILVA